MRGKGQITILKQIRDYLHLDTGSKIDLSPFSQASKSRNKEVFEKILNQGLKKLKNQKGVAKDKIYFPLDSTIISLTSKLLWRGKYHQVKLFAGLNSFTSEIDGVKIYFGQGHESKQGIKTIENTPENGIAIMDRAGERPAVSRRVASPRAFRVIYEQKN